MKIAWGDGIEMKRNAADEGLKYIARYTRAVYVSVPMTSSNESWKTKLWYADNLEVWLADITETMPPSESL